MTRSVVVCAMAAPSCCGYAIEYFASSNIAYFKADKGIVRHEDQRFGTVYREGTNPPVPKRTNAFDDLIRCGINHKDIWRTSSSQIDVLSGRAGDRIMW